MQNNLTSANTNKAYTMLFITDYKDASIKEKKFIDTIRNNLLDMPNDNSGKWMKCINLPEILVSLVDIAESRNKAYDMLDTNRYDVIFVSNKVEGKPIGAGYLKNIQRHHPNALIIPFIQATQIMGATKMDGTINTGAGILSIYNCGIYSCMIRNRLDLSELIHMIHNGGRSKEDAYLYYGLNKNLAGDVLTAKEQPQIAMQGQQGSSTGNQNESQKEVKQSDSDFRRENMVAENNNTAEPKNASEPYRQAGSSKFVENQQQKREESPQSTENQSVPEDSGERKLTYKERRKLEKKRKQEERRQMELAGSVQSDTLAKENVNIQRVESDIVKDEDTSEERYEEQSRAKFATYESPIQSQENRVAADEMHMALQQRGRMNAGLVVPGVLHGKVMFAKGNTALIELEDDIESLGLNIADIYNMPVAIPYTKFGDM